MKNKLFIVSFTLVLFSLSLTACSFLDRSITSFMDYASETTTDETQKEAPAAIDNEKIETYPYESYSATETTIPQTLSPTDLSALDTSTQNWGQGVQFDQDNRPISAVEFQKKYKDLSTYFLLPNTSKKMLCLTFDEGYENGYTRKILDILKEKKIPAIFFVTLSYAKENPSLIKRMIKEGHIVANHTASHPSMPTLSTDKQTEDIKKLHDYIKENFDYEMTLFRYPSGTFSEQSLGVVKNFGYKTLFWSFAYADWDPNKQMDKTKALQKLEERLHPGAIYLLHAVSSTNADILGDFIQQAQAKGYQFTVTV